MINQEFENFVQYHANLIKIVQFYTPQCVGGYFGVPRNKEVLDFYSQKLEEAEQKLKQFKE